MRYTKWVTNCKNEDSFSYLMKFSNEQLDKSFIIGPPYTTKPSVSTYYRYDSKNRAIPFEISQAGYTSKELEDMDLCGIYECEI